MFTYLDLSYMYKESDIFKDGNSYIKYDNESQIIVSKELFYFKKPKIKHHAMCPLTFH